MDTSLSEAPGRRRRRKHSAEFKASVVQACLQPGISMAAVALANGLNATMLRKWVMEAERVQRLSVLPPPTEVSSNAVAPRVEGFVALQLAPEPVAPTDIRIELQRAGTTISVSWPSTAATECAVWLRELLR
jgi:transposase-like protein